MICLQMGKTTEAKPHQVNLKSPIPRINYYQNKQLQVKGISVPNTILQLNSYLNTQLDLFCSDNLSFSMHNSQYMTNQLMHGSKYVTNHQLEKDVGGKVLQFINTMKIMKHLGYETLRHTNAATSSRERWTRANFVSGHNLLEQNLCIKFHQLR